jgi:Domain of unknown function (DUF397)
MRRGVQVTGRGRPCVVEVEPSGLCWAKSSASNSHGDQCAEIARDGDVVLVRSSRNRAVRLVLPAASWAAFLTR